MTRFLLIVLVLSALATQLTACNTVDGIGRDLNRAGSTISNAAN